MLRPWKNVAHALFSIISQTFTAERLALQWRENDLQHKSCTREPEISSKPQLIHRRNISFKPLDWSLTNFSSRFPQTKVSQHPHTVILTEMLIWNEKDSVKYGDFPDQYQLFRFLRARLLLQITRGTKTNYNIIEPVWPRTKRRVNHAFIWAVCDFGSQGVDSAYERGGDARRKFWIKPLKETDLGVAQAFLTPKRDQKIYISNTDFYILSCAACVLPKTP